MTMDFFTIFFPQDIEKSIESGNVRGVIRALRSPDPAVQKKAAAALADLAPHEAIRPLLNTLESPDRDVRRLSAMALGNIGDSTASSGLLTAFFDVDPRVRLEVAEALGKIRDPTAVDTLVHGLDDDNADVRMNTIWALGQMNDKNVIPYILPLLTSVDQGTRSRTAEALENLDGVPVNPPDKAYYCIAKNKWNEIPQLGDAAILPLVQAINDNYYLIRMQATRTLGKFKGPVVVDALRKALFDEEECVSIEAVEALNGIGSDDAIQALVDGLSSPFKSTSVLAGAALDRLGWKPTRGRKNNHDSADREEWDICSSLRGVAPTAPPASTGSAARDREFPEFGKTPKKYTGPTPERTPAPEHDDETLPETTEDAEKPEIINDIRPDETRKTTAKEPEKNPGEQYIQDFIRQKKPRVVDVLIRALDTEDPLLLKKALRGLGGISRADSVASIARAARDPDEKVRLGAIIALGIISRKAGLDRVVPAIGIAGEEIPELKIDPATGALEELKRTSPLITEMTRALSHPSTFMRGGAADVLQIVGWKPGSDDEQLLFNAAHPSDDIWADLLEHGPADEYDKRLEAAAEIIAKLEDPHTRPEEKRELLQVISESGEDWYTDVLVAALQDRDPGVCQEAILACGKQKDPHFVPHLLPFVKSPDPAIRKSAIETLGMIRDPGSIPSIIAAIHDEDPAIRILAAETLGLFEDPMSFRALVMNFSHEDSLMRKTVREAVSLHHDYALNRVKDFATADDAALRSAAREVLINNYERTIALEVFISLLSNPDTTIIREAAASLSELGLTLAADENFIRYFVARRDGNLSGEMEGGFLLERLKDRNPEVRKSVLMILSYIQPALTSRTFPTLLQDPDSGVRAMVASKLEEIHWIPENDDEKIRFLFAGRKWNELKETGDNAVRVLTGGMTDLDPEVRRASAELLGMVGSKNAESALIEGLHDEDREVRLRSIKSLLTMPSGESSRLISSLKREVK